MTHTAVSSPISAQSPVSDTTFFWVALNAVHGLGPVGIARLMEYLKTPQAVFNETASSLARTGLISRQTANAIKSEETFGFAGEQIDKAGSLGIHILTLDDSRYPAALRQIFAPPPVLYVRGNLDVFNKHALGVVGSRQPTPYGENATAAIVKGLTAKGIVTVSGLARGIDACAHAACINNKGRTIAVQGCGADRVYPAQNRNLALRILEEGAIVSEFPLGFRPESFNFPRRNRIISGLSAGVLVVEAGKKSGALITANFALQQGREVFAVPGPITSDRSDGPFYLIKNGATPVKDAGDIIDVIETVRQNIPPQTASALTLPPPELLSEGERMVLSQLSHEPLRMDQLADKVQKMVSELFDILLNLELKGLVRQVAGQQYVKA